MAWHDHVRGMSQMLVHIPFHVTAFSRRGVHNVQSPTLPSLGPRPLTRQSVRMHVLVCRPAVLCRPVMWLLLAAHVGFLYLHMYSACPPRPTGNQTWPTVATRANCCPPPRVPTANHFCAALR